MNIYEYMQGLNTIDSAAGVDALTLTATGLSGKLTIDMILHNLQEALDVEESKPFKFLGASGWSKGSVRYADKHNKVNGRLWAILMITGALSNDAFEVLKKMSDPQVRVTRIDVCVDIKLRERVLGLCRRLKDSAKGSANLSLVESLTGDTLYMGSRQSDMFVRMYDKSSEYGEELGRVYRWELEAKGNLAQEVYEQVKGDFFATCEDVVFGAVRKFGVAAPRQGQFPDFKMKKVTASSAEMKLNWLKSQVKPTVTWLGRLGLREEVFEALGIAGGRQLSLIDQNGEKV